MGGTGQVVQMNRIQQGYPYQFVTGNMTVAGKLQFIHPADEAGAIGTWRDFPGYTIPISDTYISPNFIAPSPWMRILFDSAPATKVLLSMQPVYVAAS